MNENFNITENEEVVEKNETTPKRLDITKIFFRTICLLTFCGMIVLFVLFFINKKQQKESIPKKVDNPTFAFVDTDTLWNKYDFVLDVQVDLAKLEKIYQNQYTSAVTKFQKEYDDYIKKGTAGLLTLNEQKKTEEQLAKKQQALQEMDADLSQKLLEEKTKRNKEIHDTIVNFIARYNKSKKYTFIFEKSFAGPLLYADSTLDITQEILTGLNKEYEKKIKKEKDKNDSIAK